MTQKIQNQLIALPDPKEIEEGYNYYIKLNYDTTGQLSITDLYEASLDFTQSLLAMDLGDEFLFRDYRNTSNI